MNGYFLFILVMWLITVVCAGYALAQGDDVPWPFRAAVVVCALLNTFFLFSVWE